MGSALGRAVGGALANGVMNTFINAGNINSVGDFSKAFASGAGPGLLAFFNFGKLSPLAGGAMGGLTNYLNVKTGLVPCESQEEFEEYVERGVLAGGAGGLVGFVDNSGFLTTASEIAIISVVNAGYAFEDFGNEL